MKTPLLKLLIIFSLLLASCSSSEKALELQPIELGKSTSVDTPETDLIRDAQKFYQNRLFTNARESFEKIRDGYPFGPYAEYSEIKIADCHFYTFDYLTAALLYTDFSKQHPASPNLPYVMVQMGRSYELQYGGLGRDIEPLNKSIEAYKNLLIKFPQSIYSEAAEKYLNAAQAKLIAYEESVSVFYKKSGQEKASLAREEYGKNVEANFQSQLTSLSATGNSQTVEVPELYKGPFTNQAVFASSSKNSKIFKDNLTQIQIPSGALRVTQVTCKPSEEQVFLFFNKDLSTDSIKKIEDSSSANNGILRFSIPEAYSKGLKVNCFSSQDLSVSENGNVSLAINKTASFMGLKNPSRLLVIFND
ncbi:MAG: outer membrane protein assembly factor BamD [bacterium]|nr:outer membrane protein assembly factor BamD [bacterium]